jgi:hypothetical protein
MINRPEYLTHSGKHRFVDPQGHCLDTYFPSEDFDLIENLGSEIRGFEIGKIDVSTPLIVGYTDVQNRPNLWRKDVFKGSWRSKNCFAYKMREQSRLVVR